MQIKLDYKRKFIYKFCFLLNYEVFMATRPTKCGVLTGLVTEYDLQLAEKIELKHQNEQIIAQISDALKSIKQFPIDNIIENFETYHYIEPPDEEDESNLKQLEDLIAQMVDRCLLINPSDLNAAERLVNKITDLNLKDKTILKIVDKCLEIFDFSRARKLSKQINSFNMRTKVNAKIFMRSFNKHYFPKIVRISAVAGSIIGSYLVLRNFGFLNFYR